MDERIGGHAVSLRMARSSRDGSAIARAGAAMARVVFEHVGKQYGGGAPVVRDLSLTIENEELLVLVGPSGCGKSTALRMIAGLEGITRGSLFIDEDRVNDTPPKDRDVAMVFQSYALYPHMTCFENMAFALQLRRMPKPEIRARVMAAAKTLAIEPLLERRPKELSGGQRQRVAIGRAIVREPRVFLMDEPLSNLDAKLRSSMRAEIKRLHRELSATIVYVTHDQTEAMTLGDRIAVMRAGDLLQCDTPAAIYDRPANAFVAAFIGLPQMNLLPGELRGGIIEVAGAQLRTQWAATHHPHRDGAPPSSRAGRDARDASVSGAREVLVGVRPEHLTLEHDHQGRHAGNGHGAVFTGVVDLAETTGADTFLHLTSEAGPIVARLSGHAPPQPGERVRVRAEIGNIHLFDRATEERLA
jgi:multiple sugar transport system ATP-binding protein